MNSGSPSGLTTVLVSPPRGSIILDPEGASLLIVKCHGQCVELGARFELHRCGMVSWCTSPIRIVAGTNHNHFYNEKYEFVRALIPRSARALGRPGDPRRLTVVGWF
jgi:hypothetical protein